MQLFGELCVGASGEPPERRAGGVAARLLAFLLLHRREALPRRFIARALWPDAAEAEASERLRHNLHALRCLLPAAPPDRPWIVADRTSIRWNPDAECRLDVQEFESACGQPAGVVGASESRAAELERAVALYRGDLLSGWCDDWVLVERERLHVALVAALRRLIELQCSSGDVRAAVASAESLVSQECLREDAHRALVGLRYLTGDREGALDAYAECRRVLVRELAVEPMPETMRLAEAVGAGAPAADVARLLALDLPAVEAHIARLRAPVPHNLLAQLTSFVGREAEPPAIVQLLREERLVTLTGPGGCGKSRLAQEVGERIAVGEGAAGHRVDPSGDPTTGTFPDGVWWIDLASLDQGALVAPTVAACLGVRDEGGRPLLAVLSDSVGGRRLLLVLDNCEHVLGSARELAESLLAAGPGLRILATSREALGAVSESVLPIPPLAVPDEDVAPRAELAAELPAVGLFVDRATSAWPEFSLTDRNAAAVAEICRRLDGMPLAIELAAARVSHMTTREIADRLDERFRLLTGGPRTVSSRHRTLAAAMDWSYETLGVRERRLFGRLSVFRGGWTAEAAAAVCAEPTEDGDGTSEALEALVAKSLVIRWGGDAARYRMLQTVREYAAERLFEAGEADATHFRHLAHFVGLAEEAEPQLRGPEQAVWLEMSAAEHNNFRAALGWAVPRGGADAERAMRLASALRWFWYMRGHLAEGREWIESALRAAPEAGPALRAKALNAAGSLAFRQGDMASARGLFEESLAILSDTGDERGVGLLLGNLGLVARYQENWESARAYYERSLAILEPMGETSGVANALQQLGHLALWRGDCASAVAALTRNLALSRRSGDRFATAVALATLARATAEQGGVEAARPLYEEALRLCDELGDASSRADVLNDMGSLTTWYGDLAVARGLLEDALRLYRDLGVDSGTAAALGNLGQVLRLEGDATGAAARLGESLLLYRRLGHDTGVCCALWSLGEVEADRGRGDRAASLFGASKAEAHKVGVAHSAATRADHDRLVARAVAQIGREAYDAAYASGEAMSVDEAVAYALGEETSATA